MKQLNPKWVDFAKSFVNGSGYFKNQKMKIVDLKYGESFVEIELDRKTAKNPALSIRAE